MSHALPSSFTLGSLTLERLRARSTPLMVAVLSVCIALAVVLLLYIRYALTVLSFSEADLEMPNGPIVEITVGVLILSGLLLWGLAAYVLRLVSNTKEKPFAVLRSTPSLIPTVFLWWLLVLFLPGMLVGMLSEWMPGLPDYFWNIVTAVAAILLISITLLVPHFALSKGLWFFRAAASSARDTWPLLQFILLRVVVMWIFSVVGIFLALLIGSAFMVFIEGAVGNVITTLWATFILCGLIATWMVYVTVFGEALTKR